MKHSNTCYLMRRYQRSMRRETSALAQSFCQYWCGVSGNCGVGINPQMFNRVTNHGDMGTFSKPIHSLITSMFANIYPCSMTGDEPDFSIDLTRSMATFHTPEILYIICRNCYNAQGDPDSGF